MPDELSSGIFLLIFGENLVLLLAKNSQCVYT